MKVLIDVARGKSSLVDILLNLEVIAQRAAYGGSDFILAGPVNLWFRRVIVKPAPYFILVTSRRSASSLKRVLSIGASHVEWEYWWKDVGGKIFRLKFRGCDIVGLADPTLKLGGKSHSFEAGSLSRNAGFAVLGSTIVRLAPISFEVALWEGLGGQAFWRVEGRGEVAKP